MAEMRFPKTASNTVRRLPDRATYDLEQVHTIINTSLTLNVSFHPDPSTPFPISLPMIGAMGSFDYPSSSLSEPLDCYVHGSISARMMQTARDSPKGLAVCVTATKVDGLVLALTPFSHSCNYRSAVLQGYARPVEDQEEKDYALTVITDSIVPARWANSRVPPTKAEYQSTAVLKVVVEHGSGKVRVGEPHDDAHDLKDGDVTARVWAGVVPVHETFGEPVPCAYNKVERVPEYIREYVADVNGANEEYAKQAARDGHD